MKRKFIMLASAVLCFYMLSGCGGQAEDVPSDESESHSVLANERIETMTEASESTVETEPDAESTSQGKQNASKDSASKTSSNQTTVKSSSHSPTSNPEQPSAQEPANPPTNDRMREYQQKIDAENERHEKVIEEANRYCDMMVGENMQIIEDWERQYDVYGGREYEYKREAAALDEKMNEILNRIALLSRDTSGIHAKEIEKLECELDDLRQERSDLEISWQVKCDIEELEEQNKTFRVDRNNKIDAENKLHEKNIQEINQQYGM